MSEKRIPVLGECVICGTKLEKRGNNVYICPFCLETQSISRDTPRATKRAHALLKLANGNDVVCAVCGCPHEEALTFGHHAGDGNEHRKEVGGNITGWILKTPIEEVLSRVRIECVYCNFVQNWTGEYPTSERRPKWWKETIECKVCGNLLTAPKERLHRFCSFHWDEAMQALEREEEILQRQGATFGERARNGWGSGGPFCACCGAIVEYCCCGYGSKALPTFGELSWFNELWAHSGRVI